MDRRSHLALGCALMLMMLGVSSASAPAAPPYEFNEPSVKAIGDEEVVFEHSDDATGDLEDACANTDIPDSPARAYRDGDGRIVLFSSHFTTRRFVGSSFDALEHPCEVVMERGNDTDPAAYNDKEWLNSLYTTDGVDVVALVHEEYQGWRYPTPGTSFCNQDFDDPPDGIDFEDHQKCWRNAITLATSADGGATFTSPGTPVAVSPYQYEPGTGAYGYFDPSNIVLHTDGLYYAAVRSTGNLNRNPSRHDGVCIMRTSNLEDPASWRAWDGTGFTVQFADPYPIPPADPAAHLCRPVDPRLATMSASLVYSRYLGKYLLLDLLAGSRGPGVYYSLSENLLSWTTPKLLMKAEAPPFGPVDCVPPHPVRVPSLIDHTSNTRNFETIGKRAYLYFTRSIMEPSGPGSCFLGLDRDLVRIPFEFFEPPVVTIDSVSKLVLGPDDAFTDVGWHSSENGSYSVRVGGSGCGDGAEVSAGSYSSSPAATTTRIDAADLALGENTIRICVEDAVGNAGSATAAVLKDLAPVVTIDPAPSPAIGSFDAFSGMKVDSAAPVLVLTASKWQDVDKLVVAVRLNEAASVEATATVSVPGASRLYRFKRVRRSVAAGIRIELKLKLARRSLKTVKRALKRGKKMTARAKITATDASGNMTVKRSNIRLER